MILNQFHYMYTCIDLTCIIFKTKRPYYVTSYVQIVLL